MVPAVSNQYHGQLILCHPTIPVHRFRFHLPKPDFELWIEVFSSQFKHGDVSSSVQLHSHIGTRLFIYFCYFININFS